MSNLKKHIERKHPLINLQPEVDDEIDQPSTSNSAYQVIIIKLSFFFAFCILATMLLLKHVKIGQVK